MKRLLLFVAAALSVTTPIAASGSQLGGLKLAQASRNQTYLNILNQGLSRLAPAYLNVPDEDKLRYGHYACQSLDAGMSFDTIFFNYAQALIKDTPREQQSQAGSFVGLSIGAGVHSFCPEHMPQLMDWLKTRGFVSINQGVVKEGA